MNAGLSNLTTLKALTLPPALRGTTDYDTVLGTLGRMLAVVFERYTNRRFTRTVGDIVTLEGWHTQYILPRYPIEAITLVETGTGLAGDWTTTSDLVDRIDPTSGLVIFGDGPGAGDDEWIRITYTGGYWWETLEPVASGYPTTQPSGSTLLPDDLLGAWALQVQHAFENKDRLLQQGLTGQTARVPREQQDLLPSVRAVLDTHRRFQLL